MIKSIIQCRMSSKRFPGKVLAPFLGKPILSHIVDRIKEANFSSSIVLATSDEKSDDPLEIYAKRLGIAVIRGSREDVVGRFASALKKHKCKAFFRICGDSPLLISPLFKHAISIYKKGNYDLVSNVFPRTFPRGMSIELINTKFFLENEKKITTNDDREHVTKYFYKNAKKFRIHNIKSKRLIKPNLKLAIDKVQDIKKVESWYLKIGEEYKKLFPIKLSK